MNAKLNSVLIFVGVIMLGALGALVMNRSAAALPLNDATDVPYPPPQTTTPPLSPIPPVATATPLPSLESEIARNYVVNTYGVPLENLLVVNEHTRNYPLTGRTFRLFTLLDTRPGGVFYDLLIDVDTGEATEDVTSIEAAEERARVEKYGKLDSVLYEQLQAMQDEEVVTVTIQLVGGLDLGAAEIQSVAFATLAAQYPEAQTALEQGGKPMDVNDPELAERIDQEYGELVNTLLEQRMEPLTEARRQLAEELRALGITIDANGGPDVLSKRDILLIAQRDEVAGLFLAVGGRFTTTQLPVQRSIGWNYWQIIAGMVLLILSLGLIFSNRRARGGGQNAKTRI